VTDVPAQPVEPKLAATVVLLRPGGTGPEVLLTQRPASMAFAADMFVFPGGRVDPDDADAAVLARSVMGTTEAAAALGGDLQPVLAQAAHVAAIRELFEEAGVLLADPVRGGSIPARTISSARTALVGGKITFGQLATDLDLRLCTDRLVPLSRWVTPPTLPRRFDARFFVAELPTGVRVSFEGDEVAGHRWQTPGAALRAMANGEIGMWLPTIATLQQLEHVRSIDDVRDHLAPTTLGSIEVERISPEVTRIVMPAGGGVAGQPVCSYLVGRERFVLIDPGDPSGPGLDHAIDFVTKRGGSIAAIALTHADPDHTGGAEAMAEITGAGVFGGPGSGRFLPHAVHELADLETMALGDVPLRAVHTPGQRPDHVAFLVGGVADSVAIVGDLDGRHGARSITGPADELTSERSRDRLRELGPGATWLPGHPPAIAPG
jgi:glyoxylase-like metal-dependent hydrolase (beta-lactamase superfamily II)/8-oxo-dGTP pyrophosphatase MutT (NUDIX family)